MLKMWSASELREGAKMPYNLTKPLRLSEVDTIVSIIYEEQKLDFYLGAITACGQTI